MDDVNGKRPLSTIKQPALCYSHGSVLLKLCIWFEYAKTLHMHEGLPGGVLVPLFPSIFSPCSHVPTAFPYLFPITCLLYTSPSPRDLSTSRMPSSA